MILARIVGTVVATRKDPRLVSNKLLVARPMDPHGKAEGNYLVAVHVIPRPHANLEDALPIGKSNAGAKV